MKKMLTILFSLSSIAASSQIFYHDINPDTTINAWDAFKLKMDPSLTGSNGSVDIWFHPFSPKEVVVDCKTDAEVLMNGSNPAALSFGDTIGSSGTWQKTSYDTLNKGGYGHWVNEADKYLGVRFNKNGQWHYGWLRLDIDGTPTFFTVKDWAYQTTADVSILAGQETITTGIQTAKNSNGPVVRVSGKMIFIEGSTSLEGCRIIIFNLVGKKVVETSLNTNKVSLEHLPAGMYGIVLLNDQKKYFLKAIIQ